MAEDAPIIGRTLAGKFRVTGVIGEGGMATVYRALQEAEPKDVAIKVMNPDLAKDSRFVRRFRREAKAASMLKHPNTVNILEFGVDDGFVFLAMECVEGSDLALLLHRERRVSEARAANIVMQVCRALGAAHELSIVHRDLKPDNIMVLKKAEGAPANVEVVKVLDFGIAKILDEEEGAAVDPRAEPVTAAKSLLTRVGTIVGTPAYMAPEQGRAEPVDGRTDVYACGVLLYELVTGRVPFSGETPMQVVMRHVNEPALPPSTFIPVHPDLEAVIMKALEKWPAQRQQTAGELAAELDRLLPHLAQQKRQAGEAPPSKILVDPRVAPAENEPSTLVIEAGAAKAPSAAPAGHAPAFPTLNIDVPEDLMVGIDAKPKAPDIRPAAGMPYPMPKPAPPPPLEELDADSDDVRTLIAREAPGGALTAPAKDPLPPLGARANPGERQASIPDLSTPIAFTGAIGSAPNPAPKKAPAAPPAKPPSLGSAAAKAPAPAPTAPLEPGSDKITTLVSAVPDEIKATNKPSDPKPGMTPIAPIKGTVKSESVEVEVSVAGAPNTVVPTTQPSAPSIALDATLAAHLAAPPAPPAAAPPPAAPTPPPAAAVEPVADVKPVDLAVTPAPEPKTDTPGSVAVWEPPPRKRLSGPMAMLLGIVIGALLFGLALLIMNGKFF
ncbi:MAG: protein kinase [Polyangiaceae bacterium]